MPCPHCQKTGTLNRHSLLLGNDPATAQDQCRRGQRVFCSDRGKRPGCGRTFSIVLAAVLPRHTFPAPLLWDLLRHWLTSHSLRKSGLELRLPFGLDTLYAIVRRLRHRLDAVRCLLCRRQPPPTSLQSDPLAQTVEHLHSVFAQGLDPIREFQIQFQQPLMG